MNHQDKEIQVIKFMLRTIRSSTFKNNTLIIDVARLNEALNNNGKIHKPDFIVKNLIKRGFVFEGYNKSLKKSQNLIMKYPINPNVIIVIDSYAKSKYAEDNDVCGSTVFDYAHFNYKLLTIGISESLQLDDLYVYQKLSKKVQSFIKEFNSTMNENNYYYGNNASNAHNWGDSQFAYSKAPEKRTNYVCRLFQRGDNLIVRLYLHNIDRYTQYIENTPDYIKKSFIDDHGKCNGCKEKCHARKTYTIDDNKYSKCQGEMLYFKSVDLEAIPYYVDLINLSATKGKYLTEK